MLAEWRVAGVGAALAVMAGAFGAHGLSKRANVTPHQIDSFKTAAHYQLAACVGALALCSAAASQSPALPVSMTGVRVLLAGTALFSGSIYALVLGPEGGVRKVLGPVTPVGGLLMIGGLLAAVLA